MKFLILLLISFSAFANFIPKSKVGTDSNLTVYLKKNKCEKKENESCIKIDSTYNYEYAKIEKEKVEDLDSPIWSNRSMVEPCLNEVNCKEIALQKSCVDERKAYYNQEYSEVWCAKITGYQMKETENDIVAIDQEKKDLYDIRMTKKNAKEYKIKKGMLNKEKCEKALALIGGTFDAQDESVTDQLEIDFAQINIALEKNRRGKALRLIKAKTVPVELEELKADIIEILEL